MKALVFDFNGTMYMDTDKQRRHGTCSLKSTSAGR